MIEHDCSEKLKIMYMCFYNYGNHKYRTSSKQEMQGGNSIKVGIRYQYRHHEVEICQLSPTNKKETKKEKGKKEKTHFSM